MRLVVMLFLVLCFNVHADIKEDIGNATNEALEITTAPFALTGFISILSVFYTTNKPKLIINAQPDAASYIASKGELNSAYLEQALVMLRKQYPNASDMELAKAILAY